VAIHPALEESGPEVAYVLRTLLRLAGVGWEMYRDESGDGADIYYGPGPLPANAALAVAGNGRALRSADGADPVAVRENAGRPTLDFGEAGGGAEVDGGLRFDADIVFASYWLLTGAREHTFARDRWDNLEVAGSALASCRLLERPLVSVYAALLRQVLEARGFAPRPLPWTTGGTRAALALTHDVDYPQILRAIETVRLLRERGPRAARLIADVWRGRSHFWHFPAWVELAAGLGGAPAFYFMARRGSLAEYELGTPDAFYDIASKPFRELFGELTGAGAEIGLHASYHAHRGSERIRAEKQRLEELAGVDVAGNRHHYWHLDPADPAGTLRHHERAGMMYDSSLAFEFHPGFRRGTCHPYRPFHPGERRELSLVELPPTWMDDHFDRRLVKNGIVDPVAAADTLLGAVRSTGGVAVLDYHVRGMNEDFFPRYGRWLREYLEGVGTSDLVCITPREMTLRYREYERSIEEASLDQTNARVSPVLSTQE
jgi:hypothetical protein